MATTTVSGSTVTFSNSGAAADLTQSGTEDGSLQFTFDVLAASGGGTKTTIYSVDDGLKNDDGGAGIVVTNKAFADYNKDLLIQDGANIVETSSTSGAKFWIGTDNKIHYDATALSAQINALGAGEQFTDTIQYTIKMSNGTLSVGTLSVVITGTNDAPVITVAAGDHDAATLNETNSPLSTNGTLTVSDVDIHDTVKASVTGVTLGGATGSLHAADVVNMLSLGGNPIIDNSHTSGAINWSFNSTPQAFDYLAAGEHLTLTYAVKADDGHGGTTTHNVTITIDGANDAVTITGATDSGTVKEDGTQTASGQLGFSDVDLSDSHTWSIDGANSSAYGSIAVDQTGKWTYTLDNAAAQSLGAGDHLTETYTVKVDDGQGSTDTRTVTIHIDGANDAPVISGGSSGSVTEDAALTVNGALTVNDPDAGQSSFQVHNGSNPIAGTYGSLTIDAGGNWVYTLNNAAANVQALTSADHPHDQIHVASADGTDHVIDITVNGADEPVTNHAPSAPVFVPSSAPIADVNPVDLGHFLSVDPDAGDSVSFAATWSGSGTVAVAANGELTASVGLGSSATGTLTVTATDSHSASSAPQSFTVWIGNANGGNVDNTITLVSTDPTIADGRAGTDSVTGTSAVDYIFGGAGNDTIIGKANADWLVGGDGADHFVYTAVADSTHAAFDTIQDFVHGADKLDFLNALNLTGTPTNLGASTTLAAHSVGWTTDGTNTVVYANAGTSAETITSGTDVIEIHLLGVNNLSSADFNLHA
ncbi:VCBS domain-containing protein [Mesorhizobium sp. B2-7-1]|uniref:VCBS domain-containing protein n=1 Tax=Mesorhizobium sp. B2-7-1 TaxID=2589909 RepID=UPI0015E35CCB|nr:VCBS domain-containing protein [Mesorhizobium sp. B2-7-1]